MQSFFAGLLLLAYLFKAIIPVGYMPDMQASKSAPFSITICTAEGPQTIQAGSSDAQPHQQQGHENGKTSMCSFAGVAQVALLAAAQFLAVPLFFAPIPHVEPRDGVVATFTGSVAQARAPPIR